MNDIEKRQNESFSVELISSFRQKYSNIKFISSLQLWLVVYFSIFLAVLTSILNSSAIMTFFGWSAVDISNYVALYCLLITFIDSLSLTKWIDEGKELAARLQEKFDCYVYSMPWNNILCEDEPSIESVHQLNKEFTSKPKNDINTLLDWYNPKVGSVELSRGVLLCQRMNLNWDKNLRETVNKRVQLLSAIWFVFLVTLSLVNGITLMSFIISVLVPFVPVFVFSYKLIQDNQRSIANLLRYKGELNKVWVESSGSNSIIIDQTMLRNIQNEIYIHRKSNRPISDKFYWKTKQENEDEALFAIDKLISNLQDN